VLVKVRRCAAVAISVAAILLLAAASAAARDAHVRSFDGTRILVHFFPAAALKAHHRAPMVLTGPGWASSAPPIRTRRPRPPAA
jgi:ABC-2 type transport system ATP-binding protein